MKRFLSFLMLGALVAFTSCTKEQPSLSGGREVKAQVSVQLATQVAKTRVAFDNPALSNMRIVMAVMYNDVVVHSETKTGQNLTNGSVPVDFDLRLVTGKNYKVAVWADFGDEFYTISTEVGTAPKVALASTTLSGSRNQHDAYFQIEEIVFSTANEVKPFVLKRPFGLIKINTSDYNEGTVKYANLRPQTYHIASINVPTELSLLDGTVGENKNVTVDWSNVSDDYDVDFADPETSKELSFDYFLTGALQSRLADFTVAYKNDISGDIVSYNFANIPVRRNFITNVTGNILTKKGSISVTIDPVWEQIIPSMVWDGNYGAWLDLKKNERLEIYSATFLDQTVDRAAFCPKQKQYDEGISYQAAVDKYKGQFSYINMPNVSVVGEYAFRYMSTLQYIDMPLVKEIKQYAFSDCDIREVNLPEATLLDKVAFQNNANLKYISLPKAETIGFSGFAGCIAVETVFIPAITYFGSHSVFSDYGTPSSLKRFEIGTNNGGVDITGIRPMLFEGTDVSNCDLILGSGIKTGAPDVDSKQWLGLTWKSITIK